MSTEQLVNDESENWYKETENEGVIHSYLEEASRNYYGRDGVEDPSVGINTLENSPQLRKEHQPHKTLVD